MTSSVALPFYGQSVPPALVGRLEQWSRKMVEQYLRGIMDLPLEPHIVWMGDVPEGFSPSRIALPLRTTISFPVLPFMPKPTPSSRLAWLVAEMQPCTSHVHRVSSASTSSRTLVSAESYIQGANKWHSSKNGPALHGSSVTL